MRLRPSLLVLACLAATVSLPATARARSGQTETTGPVVARGPAIASISTHRDAVAWVEGGTRASGGRSVRAIIGGRVRTIRREGRARIYKVDLGPGPDGRLVAVYDACRPTPRGRRRDCDLYRYDAGSRRTVPVRGANSQGGDELDPAVWGDRIVFTRSSDRLGDITYWVRGDGRKHRIPRAGRDLDLRGDRVAWTGETEDHDCRVEDDKVDPDLARPTIVERNLRTGESQEIDGCVAEDEADVGAPQYTRRGLTWQANVRRRCDHALAPTCQRLTQVELRHLDGHLRTRIEAVGAAGVRVVAGDDRAFWAVDGPPTAPDSLLRTAALPRPGALPLLLAGDASSPRSG